MKTRKIGSVVRNVAVFSLLAAVSTRADIQREIERGIGEMVSKDLERTFGVVDDPLLTGWLDRMGQRLGSVAGRKDVKYRFKILNSDEVNAVAAPGGNIYVNRGTFQFVKSEDELAAVVGHEVGHVAGKHSMKQLNAQLITMGALVGLKSVKSDALMMAGGLAGNLALLKFTRDEENDADRRGLRNMTLSGYDGESMISFFRHMESTESSKPTKLETYLLTHPPASERLRRIGERSELAINSKNLSLLAKGLSDRSLHHQAQDTYKRALLFDAGNEDAKRGVEDEKHLQPVLLPPSVLTSADRRTKLQRISQLLVEVDNVRGDIQEDGRRLIDTQKSIKDELEPAARDLEIAANSLVRSDSHLVRQFNRLAKGFAIANRATADLRSSRESADEALNELEDILKALRAAIENGDRWAVPVLDKVSGPLRPQADSVRTALRPVRDQLSSARSGARSLRIAADSLVNGLRQPLGLVGGQFDILQLQVDTAERGLKDASDGARKAMHDIALTRLSVLTSRIDFLSRSVKSDDPATAGIISHHFGVPIEEVSSNRQSKSAGETVLDLAEKIVRMAGQSRGRRGDDRGRLDDSIKSALPEDEVVLFRLIANDFERELK